MKAGNIFDEDGELIDYNKVDTALKTVGISLKDSQGQFRDFDDVIFELAGKWDSLDTVSQRYIATIAAGNRQQSRFLALMSNYDRLVEVSEDAYQSEDAGLIQYSKTLDSLETKLNNISTSFQQFYMSFFNGPTIKAGLDAINNIIQGFNNIGVISSFGTVLTLINSLKNLANIGIGKISIVRQLFQYNPQEVYSLGQQIGVQLGEGVKNGIQSSGAANLFNLGPSTGVNGSGSSGGIGFFGKLRSNKKALTITRGVGAAFSAGGLLLNNSNPQLGSIVSALGNIAMGATSGPWGAALAAITSLPGVINSFANRLEIQAKQSAQEAEEANVKRATTKDRYQNIKEGLSDLKELEKYQNGSEEQRKEWIDANNALAETFPELISYYDQEGNAIIDLADKYDILSKARQEAADAATEYAEKQIKASQDAYNVEYANYIKDVKTLLNTPTSEISLLFDNIKRDSTSIASTLDYDYFEEYVNSITDVNSFIKSITDSNGTNLQFLYDVLKKASDDINSAGQYQQLFGQFKNFLTVEGITVDNSGKLQFPTDWNMSALDSFTSLNESYQDVEKYKEAYRSTLVNNELLFEEKLVDFYDAAAKMATESISIDSMEFDSSGQLTDASKKSIQSSIQDIINGFIFLQEKLSNETSKQFLSLISDFDSGNLLTKDFYNQIGKIKTDDKVILTQEVQKAREVITNYENNAADYQKEINDSLRDIGASIVKDNIATIDGISLDTSSISKNSANQLKELYYNYTSETDDILVETYKSQFQTFLKALSGASKANEDSSIIQQMLSEAAESGDLYTYAGIQNLNKQFEENEIDFLLDFNIISETTTNLVTNYQSLMDSIAKNIESASEMVEKATKGMDYEEASTLAAKLGTTLSDSNFEIVDGKFIYKDVETIYDSYNEGLLDVFDQINSAYEDQIKYIYLGDETLISRYSGIDATDVDDISIYKDEAIDALNKSRAEAIKVAQDYYHNNLQLDVASVMDSIMEGISEGLQQLANSFSGELSAEEWTKLRQQYNISGTGILTDSGYLLDQKTQDELGVALRREATKSGKLSDYEFAKMYYEAISGTENFSNSIYDLQQRMADAQDEAKELYEDLLKIAQLDENAAEFTFMEDHPLEGWTNNFDNFVSQIDTIKNTFSSFQSEGSVGYQEFLNMMDFMSTAGKDTEGFKNFEAQLNSTGKTYEQFVNNILQNSEEWGKVDIGTIAAEMGISVDAAMGMMAESMTDGLKAVAQQQIDYLSGLEEMLEALAMLEAMGNIEAGLDIELDINGKPATIGEIPELLIGGEDPQEIIDALTNRLKDSKDEFERALYNTIAGEDGSIDFSELFSFAGIVEGIGDELLDPKALEDLSEAQAEAIANAMTSVNPEDYMKDGEMDYQSFFDAIIGMINEGLKHASEESFGSAISLALSNLGINFETDGSSITIDGQDWSDPNTKQSIIDALAAQNLAVAGEPTIDGGKVIINVVPIYQVAPDEFLDEKGFKQEGDSGLLSSEIEIPTGKIKVKYKPEDAEFYFDVPEGMTEEDAWSGLKEAFGMDDEADFTIDESGNRSFKMSFGIAEDSLSGADLATIRAEVEQIKALVSSGMELVINTAAAKTNIDLIIDALNSLQSLLSGMLKGDIQLTITGGDIPSGGEGEDSGETLNSEQVIHVSWDFDPPPEVNTPQTINVNWNAPAPPTVKSPQVIKIIYDELNRPRYMRFTGTVNNVTGPSYASGNVGSNAVNANRIATKTLVGELGPELAVYNGSYHLLGQDGAEFVNLPKDAIVFNHLQTAGIIGGQMKDQRGRPLDRALASGNVSGPALASGVQGALAAVRRAKSVWQGLLNKLSVADLLGGGGGGGGGGGSSDNPDLTPYIADLQEWYNLSRQIVDLEQKINKLIAERENISDGGKYLRNLRETQSLLQDQLNTQKDLYKYQLDEVARQGEAINNDSLLRQFYHVDESGLLQYNEGNETNGGKGALEILDELNKMTNINDQVARIESFGFSHTNKYGETLEGEEYVSAFFEALQTPIDNLDSLRDTVLETEETMADLQTNIEEINQEIRENQLDLEENIYDIIVEERQENIALLKEQNSLIKEANSSYLSGIQTALDQEKQLYEQNRAINDREVLQRQLSLLRRSGGSASEISSLEQQLDEALQNEYFSNQEKTIEEIQKANEEQTKLMDRQVKLQEEALAYDKENGVIWLKVYEVMAGSREEILEFMQGHSVDFFEKSALVQEDMLLDWAKKAGIYDENKVFEYQQKEAEKTMSNIWNTDTGKKLKGTWDTFNAETQQDIIDEYLTRYANQVMSGVSVEQAVSNAQKEFYEHIENEKKRLEENAIKNTSPSNSGNSNSSGGSGGGGGGSSSSSSRGSGGTRYYLVNPETGKVTYTTSRGTAANATKKGYTSTTSRSEANRKSNAIKDRKGYSTGGLVDYTGIAIVHGSKTKPESFINAEQTKALLTGLNLIRDINNYSDMQNTLRSLVSNPISEINSPNNQTNINVSQGAIQINIDQLNDEYDIEQISNDIMSRMYDIAAKASSRGVNRR